MQRTERRKKKKKKKEGKKVNRDAVRNEEPLITNSFSKIYNDYMKE